MKPRATKLETPRLKTPKSLKTQEDLSGRSKQLLKEGKGKRKRAILSPSQPHSKTFGH
jgi:hypothetical protein